MDCDSEFFSNSNGSHPRPIISSLHDSNAGVNSQADQLERCGNCESNFIVCNLAAWKMFFSTDTYCFGQGYLRYLEMISEY